jgi:hypothetical protein
MDAGVVRIPFGPSPSVEFEASGDGSAVVRSTTLERQLEERLDAVIEGHLEEPTIHRSATSLLRQLYGAGRIQQMSYGEFPVGSVELTTDSHPVARGGQVEQRLWMFGVLTEGIRYFCHYLPSPKSRMRAVLDIGSCVEKILNRPPPPL